MLFCVPRAHTQTMPATASSTPAEFEPFGLRLSPPPEWKRLSEGRAEVVARWGVLRPGTVNEICAMVIVELAPARGRTAAMFAKEYAQKIKGEVDENAELAGLRACRVTGDLAGPEDKGRRPTEAVITRNEQFVYVLSAVQEGDGDDYTRALQQMKQGLEFCRITAPTSYLEFRAEPIVVQRFTIRPLAVLRPSPEQRQGMVQLRAFNYRRDRAELLLTMQGLTISPPRLALEKVGAELLKQAGIDPATVEWKTLPGSTRRIMSASFEVGSRKKMPIRVGLVTLSDTDIAVVNVGLVAPDDLDRVIYESKCEAMLESVEPVAAK